MHHYQHHIGDYESATVHLSWEEDLAYTRLLRVYYRDEKPIPAELSEACRLVRAKSAKERSAVETVLKEFFVLTDDGWRNKRADKDIGKYKSKSHKAKWSANARWTQCERNANALETHCDGNANAMLTVNRKPRTVNQEPYTDIDQPSAGDEPPKLPDVVIAWNSIPGVIHVREMTKARKKHLAARMNDPVWETQWASGIERVKASAFCRGSSESGWKADFDWFIKPDSLTKILEGKYDDRAGNQKPGTRDVSGGAGANFRDGSDERGGKELF